MSARSRPDPALFVALLAGGRGTRFWPLSRRRSPKQLLSVTGEGSLLAATRERIEELLPPANLLVVTSRDLAARCRRLLELPAKNVLAEPVARNTAAAVGLALLVASVRRPDAVLLALPSDHHVGRPARLRTLLRRGVRAARRLQAPVLFGAVADRAETGYGYLVPGRPRALPGAAGLRRLRRFQEKPDPATARRLLSRGAWWNTGMFCLPAASTLRTIEELMPELGRGLAALRPRVDRRGFAAALAEIYPSLPSISFDHGLLERMKGIHALPAEIAWSDVASWESLHALLPADGDGNRVRGAAILHGARDCLVVSTSPERGRTLVLLGTKDLALIDAGDVILACPMGRDRDVAGLLRRLATERPDLP